MSEALDQLGNLSRLGGLRNEKIINTQIRSLLLAFLQNQLFGERTKR